MSRIKKGNAEKAFDLINITLMLIISFVTIYPIWYCLIISFNDATDAMKGGIYWLPRIISFDSYIAVFNDSSILKAFGVSIARVLLGTTLNVFFTAMVSYGFSKRFILGRRFYFAIGIVTLFFSGGLIPTFLLIRNLHLYNNFLVYIFPSMFSFYNLLIFQSFFSQIPDEIEDAAEIDGANHLKVFLSIIIPLSKPVLATIALYVGVQSWNDYFTGVIYIKNNDLLPIQTYLYKIIVENTAEELQSRVGISGGRNVTSTSITLATMIVVTLPIVLVYPFLQKYFVKGMLLGSVKG